MGGGEGCPAALCAATDRTRSRGAAALSPGTPTVCAESDLGRPAPRRKFFIRSGLDCANKVIRSALAAGVRSHYLLAGQSELSTKPLSRGGSDGACVNTWASTRP